MTIPDIKDPSHFSLWSSPLSPIANFRSSSNLPTDADVVIIGSGFSGSSVAYHLLVDEKERGDKGDGDKKNGYYSQPSSSAKPRVVMLEARQTCSGATGRNGGHLHPTFSYGPILSNSGTSESNSSSTKPDSQSFFSPEKRSSNIDKIAFDIQNYHALASLVHNNRLQVHSVFTEEAGKKKGYEAAGWQVFGEVADFEHTCANIQAFRAKLAIDGGSSSGSRYGRSVVEEPYPIHIYQQEEARRLTGLNNIVGAVHFPATPFVGYTLVTWMLLQAMCQGNLNLQTNTPVKKVVKVKGGGEAGGKGTENGQDDGYVVVTERGQVRAKTVIFATNAYTKDVICGNGGDDDDNDKHTATISTTTTEKPLNTVPITPRLRTEIYPVRGQVALYKAPRTATHLPLGEKTGKLSMVWKDEYMAVIPTKEIEDGNTGNGENGKQGGECDNDCDKKKGCDRTDSSGSNCDKGKGTTDKEYETENDNDDDIVHIIFGGFRRYGSSEQVGYLNDNKFSHKIDESLDRSFQTWVGIPLKEEEKKESLDMTTGEKKGGKDICEKMKGLKVEDDSSSQQQDLRWAGFDTTFTKDSSTRSSDKPRGGTKVEQWTGIMGFTEDHDPCVGSLVSPNTSACTSSPSTDTNLLIVAGFGGHGMPRIFLSAKALVHRYLKNVEKGTGDREWPIWFPKDYIN